MGRTYHKLSVGRESFEIDTRSVLLSQMVAPVMLVQANLARGYPGSKHVD